MGVFAAAVFVLGLIAARHARHGDAEGDRHQGGQHPFCFHLFPFLFVLTNLIRAVIPFFASMGDVAGGTPHHASSFGVRRDAVSEAKDTKPVGKELIHQRVQARGQLNSTEEGRSVAAERRAKTHFGPKDQIVSASLARAARRPRGRCLFEREREWSERVKNRKLRRCQRQRAAVDQGGLQRIARSVA